MNGQPDVLTADTTILNPVLCETDSLIRVVGDSMAIRLPVEYTDVEGMSSLVEIYGGAVKVHSESRAYPDTRPNAGTPLSVFDISIIIFIIITWLLIINRYLSETGKIIKGVVFPSLIKQAYETAGIYMRSCLRLTFGFTFLLLYTVLVYFARAEVLHVPLFDINVYLYVFAVLSVFFLVRYVFSSFMTKMLSDRGFKKVRSYNNIYFSALSYALAPLTAMLFMSYAGSVFSYILLALITALFAGYYIFVFRIFYFEKLPFNQFFMYLCTVEIIPLAFAIYMIFWG